MQHSDTPPAMTGEPATESGASTVPLGPADVFHVMHLQPRRYICSFWLPDQDRWSVRVEPEVVLTALSRIFADQGKPYFQVVAAEHARIDTVVMDGVAVPWDAAEYVRRCEADDDGYPWYEDSSPLMHMVRVGHPWAFPVDLPVFTATGHRTGGGRERATLAIEVWTCLPDDLGSWPQPPAPDAPADVPELHLSKWRLASIRAQPVRLIEFPRAWTGSGASVGSTS